ncbi:MAG: 4Fe-4S binding protein [Armatimonadota bacterium]
MEVAPKIEPNAANAAAEQPRSWRIDLFAKFPWLERFVRLRAFQFLVILPNLALFYVFLLAGIFGSPVGNRNIIIVFVWILWWFLLIAVMVPFGSRVWCTVCPLPFFGEWAQRRALINVRTGCSPGTRNQLFGLLKRWPRKLSNIWLQNFGFLFLATFSAMLVTRPIVSVLVLGGMILLAAVMALIWRHRTFCNYVCPISGFLSLYAMTSTVELRSADKDVCRKCRAKACTAGSPRGWACPWFLYMGKLDRNNYCGLCMECVKTCPHDNVRLYLRPFCSDTTIKGYDEVWKAFIMLVLAMGYSVVLLGPWGTTKDWANVTEVGQWAGFAVYALVLWFAALVGFPAIYYLAIRAGRWLANRISTGQTDSAPSLKHLFIRYAYTLVPLGLLAWIAFSVPLLAVNGSYIISVLSDPMGRGWDLFGTAHFPWTPLHPEWVPYLQIPLLLAGLYYALRSGHKIALELWDDDRQAARSMIPLTILLTGVTIGFMRMFVG